MKPDHLVKVLAEHGVASRRASEKLIRDGKVSVDGRVVQEPGALVDPRAQRIQIDDDPLPAMPKPTYMVLHKPKGALTTRQDPEGRRTIFDVLPADLSPAVTAVGRLDFNTEGVLLLTTDGELAYRLTHPAYGVAKTYLVKVSGTPEPRKLTQLARGVDLADGKTGPALVELVGSVGPSSWLLITISEGRNRIVRRMVDHIGHRVLKLKRVAFGGITLRNVGPGEARNLTRGELEHLRRQVGEQGKPTLKVSWEVRKSVAEALRLPVPEREDQGVKGRDAEGRPFRKKGWARPKAKTKRPGKPHRPGGKPSARNGGGKGTSPADRGPRGAGGKGGKGGKGGGTGGKGGSRRR